MKYLLALILLAAPVFGADRTIDQAQFAAVRAPITQIPRRFSIVIFHCGGETRKFRNRIERAFQGQGPNVAIVTDPVSDLPDGILILHKSNAAQANRVAAAFTAAGFTANVSQTAAIPVHGLPDDREIWVCIGDAP